MPDWLDAGTQWSAAGQRWSVAVLVAVRGSSPREVGSVMAVREDGLMVGSVSGGCVETAVVKTAVEVIRTGESRFLEFGPDDAHDPWQVGLTCGGSVTIAVCPWPADRDPSLFAMEIREAGRRPYACELVTGITLSFAPVPRLIIVGAVHIATCLVRLASAMGYETWVIDPRCAFAVPERFPVQPTRLVPDWPQQCLLGSDLDGACYGIVLSHDPKIDDPALELFLRAELPYVGALGGRKSLKQRRVRLTALGFSEQDLGRLRQPIGLDIGARSPEDIALAIVAEVTATHRTLA